MRMPPSPEFAAAEPRRQLDSPGGPQHGDHAGSLSRRRLGLLSVQGRFSGRQFDDDANLDLLHCYFRLGAYASRDFGRHLTAFAAGDNILDRSIQAGKTPTLTLASPRVADSASGSTSVTNQPRCAFVHNKHWIVGKVSTGLPTFPGNVFRPERSAVETSAVLLYLLCHLSSGNTLL